MAWPSLRSGLQEVLGRTRPRSSLSYRSRCADAPNARIHEKQLLPTSAASSRRYPPFVSPHVGDVAAGQNKSPQLTLSGANEELSNMYLDGEDILFADSRAELDAEISKLRETAVICNALANWLDAEPVAVECFT